MRIISPSLLSANFAALGEDIKMIESSEAEWLHVDVMDGVFVTNISYGYPILEVASRLSSKVIDVHLMITQPENHLKRFVEAGADMLTFHLEATTKVNECIEIIRAAGAKVGISIKPATPVESVRELLPLVDMVLIMSVEPGYGGQGFIEGSVERVSQLKGMITQSGCDVLIEVDGGISTRNSQMLFDAGADVLVAGSSVFKSASPRATIKEMLTYEK